MAGLLVSTFGRMAKVAATGALGVFAILGVHCSSDGACVRYSDCSSGMTCANGRCVQAPESTDTDAGDASSTEETGADDGSSDGGEDAP